MGQEEDLKRKIAVLMCGWNTTFVKDFLNGMQRASENRDIDLYVFNSYDYTEYSGFINYTGFSVFNLINYEDFDGIVLFADLINNARVLEKERQKILKSGKPVICVNKALPDLDCIKIDNYTGMYELLTHMVKFHNCKSFAYISGKETFIDMAERYKAFRTVVQENEIKVPMEDIHTIESSDYNCAYKFFTDYVKQGKKFPEVFVCVNDQVALALLKVAKENNIKVPEDLKVVGYDDWAFARISSPSLTTIKNSTEEAGYAALNHLLDQTTYGQNIKIKSEPIYRESCGCSTQTQQDISSLSLDMLEIYSKSSSFNYQLNNIEEIFTEAEDVFSLLTNIETYFNKSHEFEGSDFCIFLKSDWSSILINSVENLPLNLSYGAQVQSICSIQDGKKYPREMISTRNLIPNKMKTEGSNVFLFLPIYHHSYVHGYFVTKNNLSLIENKYGYRWSRNFGTSIEHFRKRNMYKQMSQQYLKLSTNDALSGMLNRIGLEKLAKPFYASNKKNGLTTVLFFVDINKMKHINDQFGHLHGDLAVKTVSAAVLETVPKNWLCIRYGGDEFLVVGNSHNYNGEDYCSKIKERLFQKTSIMHLPYNLSASVGTYSVPATSPLTLEQAVEHVDSIMYAQKQEYHRING